MTKDSTTLPLSPPSVNQSIDEQILAGLQIFEPVNSERNIWAF